MKSKFVKLVLLLMCLAIVFLCASCGIAEVTLGNNEAKVDNELFTNQALIDALNENGLYDLTKTGVLEVSSVSITDSKENIGFEELRAFKNLEELKISNCDIDDYSFVNDLANLKKLVLCNNSLEGEIALSLQKLEYLEIRENDITSVSGNLDYLNTLNLKQTDINNESFNSIIGAEGLQHICISYTKVDDLECLLRFHELESIEIIGLTIDEFEHLQEFEKLNSIYLDKKVDRSSIDFLESNFKDGDIYTKSYVVSKRNNILLRD